MGALSSETQTSEETQVRCPGCRGRGWRLVSSRRETALRLAADGPAGEGTLPRRGRCGECSGSGRVIWPAADPGYGLLRGGRRKRPMLAV